MELKKIQSKIQNVLQKYKYAFIILIIGIGLMIIPGSNDNSETSSPNDTVTDYSEKLSIESDLKNIISHIKGVGRVEVMLKESAGEEILYQTDQDMTVSDASSSTKVNTITISDGSRTDQGLIRQIIPATYMGAIIICEGADDPNVKLAVTEAVSKITGLGADKIAVLKMK